MSCRCQTPLVRSRKRELFCVDCQLDVRAAPGTTGGAEGQQLQQAGVQDQGGAEVRESPAQAHPGPVLSGRAARAPAAAQRAGPHAANRAEAPAVSNEVGRSVACVLRVMAEARALLEGGGATGELVNRHLLVLRDCADVLSALQRV
jgi:hypothetical protein